MYPGVEPIGYFVNLELVPKLYVFLDNPERAVPQVSQFLGQSWFYSG